MIKEYNIPIKVEINRDLGYPMIFFSGIEVSDFTRKHMKNTLYCLLTNRLQDSPFNVMDCDSRIIMEVLKGKVPENCINKDALRAACAEYDLIARKLTDDGALCAQNFFFSQAMGAGPKYIPNVAGIPRFTECEAWYQLALTFVKQQMNKDGSLRDAIEEKHQIHVHLVRHCADEDKIWVDDLYLILPHATYNIASKESWEDPEFVENYISGMAAKWLSTEDGWKANCATNHDYNWGDLIMDLALDQNGVILTLIKAEHLLIEESVDIMVDQDEHLASRDVQGKIFIPGDDDCCGIASIDFQNGSIYNITLYEDGILDKAKKMILKVGDNEFTAIRGIHAREQWSLEVL